MRNKKLLAAAIPALFFCIAGMVGCTHKTGVVPDVSFNSAILPVIRQSCSINSTCHIGASNANGHIDLSDSVAYNTIISKGLINLNTPASSLLYSEIETGFMPKAPYAALSKSQQTLILDWIEQGAKDN